MRDVPDPTRSDLQMLDALVAALAKEAREGRVPVVAQAAVALAAFRHRAALRDPAALGLAVTLMNRPEVWAALDSYHLGWRPLDA